MASLVPTITFSVDLLDYPTIFSTDFHDEGVLTQIQKASVLVPHVGSVKHGDTFTLSGSQAIEVRSLGFRFLKIVEDAVAPTVTTDEVEPGYVSNMTVSGTITDEGSSPVTEYGWVWSYSENPTIDDDKVVVGTESYVGSFSQASGSGSMEPGQTIYARAYATNDVGTSYGEQLEGEAYLCFVEGTLVTLADRSVKPIERITYSDRLLVWNFDDGRFDSAKPLWICDPFELPHHRLMKFSDGSDLSVASYDKGHRIFNVQRGCFTNLNTPDTPLGTESLTDGGRPVYLVGDRLVERKARFYNVITSRHINMFANGILTSCRLNNMYPIVDFKFVKDGRKLRDIREFAVSKAVFKGLRLAEQPDYAGLIEKARTISKSLSKTRRHALCS
jgi:hypothetical protein